MFDYLPYYLPFSSSSFFSLPPATINITNKLSNNENYCALNKFKILEHKIESFENFI